MRVILFKRPDSSVAVVGPPTAEFLAARGMTEEEGWQYILDTQAPADAEVVELQDPAFPADRMFRDAWEVSGNDVAVNMAKARAIHQERIDAAKRTKARELIERETAGEDVAAEKTALRGIDVSDAIRNAQSPEVLHAVWPSGLPR